MKTASSNIKSISSRAQVTVFAFLLSAAMALTTVSECHAAGGADILSFDLNLPSSLLGEGSSTIYRELQRFHDIILRDADINIKFNLIDSWKEIVARLEAGKTDVAWLPPYYYMRARMTNSKSKLRPLVIYEGKGSTRSPICIYVRTSDDLSNLDDLLATRVSFPDEAGWVILNHIFLRDPLMSSNQVEPDKFFTKFRILTRESSAMALIYNAVDAAVLEPIYLDYMDQKQLKISKLACTAPLPNTTIVYRANLDPLMKETMELILTTMHETPELSRFRRFFSANSGLWSTATEKDLEPWKAIYKESVRNGWDKSFKSVRGAK